MYSYDVIYQYNIPLVVVVAVVVSPQRVRGHWYQVPGTRYTRSLLARVFVVD